LELLHDFYVRLIHAFQANQKSPYDRLIWRLLPKPTGQLESYLHFAHGPWTSDGYLPGLAMAK